MANVTAIDGAGRVVIPKRLRDALRLHAGTRLHVTGDDRRIVLEPIEEEPVLIHRDGLVLIGGELVGTPPDLREDRDDRLEVLTRRATGRTRR